MLRLISRGFNLVDYGLRIIALQITLMAQNAITLFSLEAELQKSAISQFRHRVMHGCFCMMKDRLKCFLIIHEFGAV